MTERFLTCQRAVALQLADFFRRDWCVYYARAASQIRAEASVRS